MPHAGVSDSFTASDVRGGGSRVPLVLLASFLFSTPDRPPKTYGRIPVIPVHGTEDHWTPPAMSLGSLRRSTAPT
jgi:hypothetical protein